LSAISEDERLSLAEAANRLGVSVRTTRRLIDRGELVAYRPSERKVWIHEEDLIKYLEAHKTTVKVTER
jgi:excisionase family DNA binding protein